MSGIMNQTTEASIASAAGKVGASSGLGSAVGGIFVGLDWAVVLGLTFSALSLLVGWYFNRRKDERDARREAREADLQKARDAREAASQLAREDRDREFHEARMHRLLRNQIDSGLMPLGKNDSPAKQEVANG